MVPATAPPAGWKIRQVPWLAPGTSVAFTGQDLTLDVGITTTMTVGATLGSGGQAAVFSVSLPGPLMGSWAQDDVALRVSYEDEEYGRDPRRTAIYQHLASLRGDDPWTDPLEGLLRLHAVGHLPPPDYLPGQDLWAQVLDRGGIGLQRWIGGNHPDGLGHEEGVAVMLPIMRALAECHRQGIVHRDIKPGNVFVNVRCPIPAPVAMAGSRAAGLFAAGLPFLRLGDLGSMTYLSADVLARIEAGIAPEAAVDDVSGAAVNDRDAMTHAFTTNVQSGPFTPPEVWSSAAQAEAHPAGDVWQLAVTMYYACTGELPFEGWRSAQWRTQRSKYVEATQAGEPNAASLEHLPERLQYLLRWSLAADPLDRPDLASLTEELAELPGVQEVTRRSEGAAARRLRPAQVSAPTEQDPPRSDTAERDSPPEHSDSVTTPSGVPVVPAPVGDMTVPAEGAHPVAAAPAAAASPDPAWSEPRTTSLEDQRPAQTAVEQGSRPGRLAALAATLVAVLLLVAGAAYLHNRTSGDAGEADAPAPTSAPSASPLGNSGTVQWNLAGKTLSQVLPQLFSDTPLAQRPNLGTLQENSFQFCSDCVSDGVRLKVNVTPPAGPTLVANSTPQGQPSGPYLVVMTSKATADWSTQYTDEPLRSYDIPAKYASAKYDRVVLVPINDLGTGSRSKAWQSQVSGSRKTQQLVFDIPQKVAYVTVLWFNDDGVVGFNQFTNSHRRDSVGSP